MCLKYTKNGDPYETCHHCNGRGYHVHEDIDFYTGAMTTDTMKCSGCNGTGNFLWMCAPDKIKSLGLELESDKQCTG